MTLLNQAVQVSGQIGKLFDAIRGGQAPAKFSREFLRDLGFKSSNHLNFIPLMKGLGFVATDGTPTDSYKSLLDPTGWRKAVAEAVKQSYSDIFTIKSNPGKADQEAIVGKYRSTYNLSQVQAERAARTFLALLELADSATLHGKPTEETKKASKVEVDETVVPVQKEPKPTSLHYNIEIHLPTTKDLEVYNAIFKSLKEHLLV